MVAVDSLHASGLSSGLESSGDVFMTASDNRHDPTEQMFALVGRAITQWSFVEDRLCSIYMICVGSVDATGPTSLRYYDTEVPTAVFYSVENFRGKLAMVEAVICTRFSRLESCGEEILSEWANLREKARKLSLKRNRLAHWTVLPGHEGDEYGASHSPRLVPPFGSPGYYRETGANPGKQTLKPNQIVNLEHAFYLLSVKLRNFCHSLAQREELLDIAVELVARRIRSLDQSDPIRAERLRQILSSPEEL